MIAGSTAEKLLPDESFYYSKEQEDCWTMPLSRMDSCAGLIISPKELARFANLLEVDVEQRGSLDGCESLLVKQGVYTMAICCNKRKSYEFKLPLR